VLYTCVLCKLFGKYFSAILPLFFSFVCVKRSDDDSGCPDGKVDSSGHPFFLSGWACFCDLRRGTPFGRLLSSVRTVNPVGLNHILPASQPSHSPFLVLFVVLCIFSMLFMHNSQVHMSSLNMYYCSKFFNIWVEIMHIWFSILFGLCCLML
jgi:hypothetical protein